MKKDKLILNAQKRDVFGKRLRKLRHSNVVPANIFGPQFDSLSITVQLKDFVNTYKVAKETGVVYVSVDGKEIPVLIKYVQKHPVNESLIHVDFRKIDLTQKIETSVPVNVTGTSPAVSQKGGVLLTQANHITVEALPEDIPTEILVDISALVEIGNEIKIQDLPKSAQYTVKEEPEKVLFSVIEHKEESVTPEVEAAAPEITTEKKTEEGAEGAAGAAEPTQTEDKGKDKE